MASLNLNPTRRLRHRIYKRMLRVFDRLHPTRGCQTSGLCYVLHEVVKASGVGYWSYWSLSDFPELVAQRSREATWWWPITTPYGTRKRRTVLEAAIRATAPRKKRTKKLKK